MSVFRPPTRRRRAGIAVACAVAAGSALVAPAGAATSDIPASQPLVVLLGDHVARALPDVRSRPLSPVTGRRPLTHVRTVLPVLERATSAAGLPWIRVALPGRPLGLRGWIPAAHTRAAETAWYIVVDRSARSVTVFLDGRAVRRFRAIVGHPATPTPRGRFFVEEALALQRGAAGGPFALALSARSHVLQEFEGGPGQIALHGVAGLRGALGTAVSHGCIRLDGPAITWLAHRIGAGVPVTVTD
jgi:lipoprotein-anchoring transpeptidase ErfK/SrfK